MRYDADVIVVGGGVMGSSAAWHLVKRKRHVIVLDQFSPGTPYGSSSGATRNIRLAYSNPRYVELCLKALAGWRELECTSGCQIYRKTGGLDIGAWNSPEVQARLAGLRKSGVKFSILHDVEIADRFPMIVFMKGVTGLFQPDGGILHVPTALQAFRGIVEQFGGRYILGQRVVELVQVPNGVEVRTASNSYVCRGVIVAAGAWATTFLPSDRLHLLKTTLEQYSLFQVAEKTSLLNSLPVLAHHFTQVGTTATGTYAFPSWGNEGVKVGERNGGRLVVPTSFDRNPCSRRIERDKTYAKRVLGISSDVSRTETGIYTSTPDDDFLIDYCSSGRNVVLGSGCSGHGFKFAPIIGELLCKLVLHEPVGVDLSLFSFLRFDRSEMALGG